MGLITPHQAASRPPSPRKEVITGGGEGFRGGADGFLKAVLAEEMKTKGENRCEEICHYHEQFEG